MRFVNEVRSSTLGQAAAGRVEGVVHVRGFEARAGGRGFGFERHDPEAIVIRGEDEIRSLPLAPDRIDFQRAAVPVAIYIAARLLFGRKRGRSG